MEKFSGIYTQIQELKKALKKHSPSKNPKVYKETLDALEAAEKRYNEEKERKAKRQKAKEEASKPVEATSQPIEVVKESSPTPTEVTKESDTNHFAIDAKVEPTRGTPGSWGTVIRSSGTNGDPLCYIKWAEGPLKNREEYGAYYESDLRMKVEKEAVNTDYVPRSEVYNLEADLKSNYEKNIKDLEEEHKTALEKGEAVWAARLEQKINDAKKAYEEKFGNEKHAENENGSGGTNKLKVVDLNPPYDKDPQEKSTGYGGDRPMGAMVAPNGEENSLPLESSANVGWDVYLNGKKIDKVFYTPSITAEEVKKGLVEHDNYDPGITVKKEASLKFADLDLGSVEKRWALYVDGKLAIRTLTRSKAERIAKEKFPEQVAAGKYEIKREDHVPVEASLEKQAIHITVGEKLFVVNSLAKTADNEYVYDVDLADGSKLFKITSADEMGQDHLSYVIEKELLNHKEASQKCEECDKDSGNFKLCDECRQKAYDKQMDKAPNPYKQTKNPSNRKASLAKLTSNLAFLKKGSFVSILDVDNNKKQIKFASLDNSLRGWAPMQKFAAMDVPQSNLVDHDGHKDEILSESGNELLVTCPANSNNVIWREVVAPPCTPESLNDLESAKECSDCHGNFVGQEDEKCPTCGRFSVKADVPQSTTDSRFNPQTGGWKIPCEMRGNGECSESGETMKVDNHFLCPKHHMVGMNASVDKKARGCDQCNAAMINGVFCHETGCPNQRKQRDLDDEPGYIEESDIESSLNKDAHIRHEDGKWIVYNHDYTKTLGSYPTKEKALKRLRQIEFYKRQGSLQPLSKKEADQDISLEQQVQSFKDRMSAVTERLSNPPAKTADLETTQDLSNVEVKDLSEAILHLIDMIESKVGENVSADPELHPMLEDLENKVWEIEMKLGIRPEIPEHEALEPEHKEIQKEIEKKEEPVEKESVFKSPKPTTPPPPGMNYVYDEDTGTWSLITGATVPTPTGGSGY